MDHDPNYCRFCGERLSTAKREGKERYYCEKCDRVLWQNRSPSVGVVIEKNEKLLLVKRGIPPWEGKWSLPAGYTEVDETPEESAARELEEETGIKVEEGKLKPFRNLNVDHPDGKKVLVMVYRAENFSGTPEAKPEVQDAGFKDPEEVEQAPLLQKVLKAIDSE